MAGLYKDFDEIMENCPDSIYDAIKYIKDEHSYMEPDDSYDEERAKDIYVSTVAYMELGSLYDKTEILRRHSDRLSVEYGDKYLTQELPKEYDRQSEALCLSSALHILHKMYPDVHSDAIGDVSYLKESLAHQKGINIEIAERDVYFEVPEHLTGKDAFPEYLSKLIDEKLEGIREDIYIEKSITWEYSHLDYGEDYDYSESETPYITLRALNPQVLDMAERRLESITDREMLDKKELLEKQHREELQKERIEKYSKDKPEPYFENNVCACYRTDELPKDFSSYTINHDKDDFVQMFTITTNDTHLLCINANSVDPDILKDFTNNSHDKIGDKFSSSSLIAESRQKGYQYDYAEIKDEKEFKEKLDNCMERIIERNYDKEHDMEHEKDIEVPR